MIKIIIGYKEGAGFNMNIPHITVTIENSKFQIKPKDAQRLTRMSNESNFSKILESKVEPNYKISKIIANALHW